MSCYKCGSDYAIFTDERGHSICRQCFFDEHDRTGLEQLKSENAVLRKRLARLVEAINQLENEWDADWPMPYCLVEFLESSELASARDISAYESGKEEILSLQAAAANILFKHRQGVPLEAVDLEWLEQAVGEKSGG